MIRLRNRSLLLASALVLLLAALVFVAGCQEANDEPEATDTEATEATDTETTAGTEDTAGEATDTTTAEADSTGTTETGGAAGESLAPVSDSFRTCADCHSDFNQFLADSTVLTPNFSHALHLNQGFECESCHVVPTHEPDKINQPPMLKCFSCHGQEADATAPGECSLCHPADFPLVPANHTEPNWLPPATPAELVATVDSQHSGVATQDRAYCEMCHAQQFCQDCHNTEMPHPADWTQVHPTQVRDAGSPDQCLRCHPQELLCNTCHHPGFEAGGGTWRQQHPPIVRNSGAEGCFQCHNPLTCARCHVTGEYQSFD